MFDELELCYSKFLSDADQDKDSGDGADASDVLVEILLSFASRPSRLFRRVSEQVFGAFADQITANGLDSLISVSGARLGGICCLANGLIAGSGGKREPFRTARNV